MIDALRFYQGLGSEPVPLAASDAPSTVVPEANVEIRWPGMEQLETTPQYSVSTPGIGWERYYAGGITGPFNPGRRTLTTRQAPLNPPHRTLDPNLTNPNAFSNGQPSGRTNSQVAPRPFDDVPLFRGLDLGAPTSSPNIGWNHGQADRSFSSDDVLSEARAVPYGGGSPALIHKRIGSSAPRTAVVMYQDAFPEAIAYRGSLEGQGIPGYVGAMQPGQMPPTMSATMARHAVTVQRRSGDTFSPIPNLGKVAPGEAIRYRSDGGNLPFDTVRFRVLDAVGNSAFEFDAMLNSLLSGWVDTVAPAMPGPYTLTAEVRSFPFLTFTHFAEAQFVVDPDAPAPPSAPPGKDFLGNLKGIIIAAAVLAGVILVVPRIVPRRG